MNYLLKLHPSIFLKKITPAIAGVIFILNSVLFASPGTYLDIPPKSELDSIKNELKKCDTDTCQFNKLFSLFWKHRSSGSKYQGFYSYWAFEVIKDSKNKYALSNAYDSKAIVLTDLGRYDSAFICLNKAISLSKEIGFNFRIAWSSFGLGNLFNKTGNYRQAINSYKDARKYFLKEKIFYGVGQANENIAHNYVLIGKYDSAIVFFKNNLSYFKKYPDKKQEIYHSLKISNCYRMQNDIKKSVEYLYSALNMAESMKDDDLLITVYYEVGDFFFEQKGNYGVAREYYTKVLELGKRLGHKKLVADIYSRISKTYLKEDQDSMALSYNLKSLQASKELNYRHSLSNSYVNLGRTYKKLGNNKLALENFKNAGRQAAIFVLPLHLMKHYLK